MNKSWKKTSRRNTDAPVRRRPKFSRSRLAVVPLEDRTVFDANASFTWAIEELRLNWSLHRSRFLAETKP